MLVAQEIVPCTRVGLHRGECAGQCGGGLGTDRLEQALVGDLGQVGCLELDCVEAVLPPGERLAHGDSLSPGHGVAEEVLEVALPCDERHDRHRAGAGAGLDELGDLGALGADELGVGQVRGQPQHEFVEEQHDGPVTEGLGMRRDELEAVLDANPLTGTLVGTEVRRHQCRG